MSKQEFRALSADEVDLVSGAQIVMSFDFFGTRYVLGVTDDGAYVCANGATSGKCIRQ